MWESANIIQIQINIQKDAIFRVKITGSKAMTLYDRGGDMSCMSYTCYIHLKDPPTLQNIPTMSVHSATGHDLWPIGLACHRIMIENLQFRHMFIMCKNLQKELIMRCDVQHLCWLGCHWTDNGDI